MAVKSTDVEKFLSRASLSGAEPKAPVAHIVLGSGFGIALKQNHLQDWQQFNELHFKELLSLTVPSAPDHAGRFVFYKHQKTEAVVCFQVGRLHGYEGLSAQLVVAPVMLARHAGVSNFILTNASGALTTSFAPGEVMLIQDHVNLTGQNPLLGPNPKGPLGEVLGPRFPDLSVLYPKSERHKLRAHFSTQGLKVHEGIYLGVLGPSFETPAEVQLFGRWGLHAVGMSTVWEAIALGHAGAKVSGVSLISNWGCGLSDQPLSHELVLETSRASASKTVDGIFSYLEEGFRS